MTLAQTPLDETTLPPAVKNAVAATVAPQMRMVAARAGVCGGQAGTDSFAASTTFWARCAGTSS